MSASILFDSPGPRTIARHRIYTVIAVVVLIAAIAYAVKRLADDGQFEYDMWEVFITPSYIQAIIVDGVLNTLKMAFSAILGAVVIGVIFGIGKLSDHGFVRWPSWLFVEFFRAVPVLLLMVLFYYQFGITHGDTGAYWSVVFALTVYNGAVLAEVFRAGVLAVPAGQAEAAYAMGMRKTQVMLIIQLPQAVKIMIPAIISQCVVALKDTSLGYAVTAPGLTFVGKQIYGAFHNPVPTVIVMAAIYITLNLILTGIATWVQKKFVGERKIDMYKVGGGMATGENTGGAGGGI
jgi:glutamate transport system permease protein